MANETKLKIVIDAENNTTAGFTALKKQLDVTKISVDGVSDAMKTVGQVGSVALAGLTAFIGSSVKSYGEAQLAIANVDATLKAMETSTRTVVTGTKEVAGALKLTGTDAELARNKIAGLNIRIKEQEESLVKLAKEHKKSKTSNSAYKLSVDQTKNSIEANKIAILKYQEALSATDKKTVDITKSMTGIGGTFADVKNKILDASNSVVRLGFDDEAAAVSITKLFQRTGDLTEAIKLNNLAMDLARAKNIGLEQASQMISLVMSGNARALKEYGIELKATGDPMEAIAELQKVVGGQAEAATSSILVQGQVLHETFSNLQDTIGKQFTPVLTEAVKALVPIIEKVGAWIEQNPELAKKIIITTLALAGILAVMLPIGMALPGIAMGFSAVAGAVMALAGALGVASVPAWGILALIGLLTVAIVQISRIVYILATDWQTVWAGMKIIADEVINSVISAFEGMVNFIISGVNKAIEMINKVIKMAQKVPGVGSKVSTFKTFDNISIDRVDSSGATQSLMSTPSKAVSSPLSIYVSGNNFLDSYGSEQIGDLIMQKLKMSNAI